MIKNTNNCKCKICNNNTSIIRNNDIPTSIYRCIHCGFTFTINLDSLDEDTYEAIYKYPEYLEIDKWAKLEHMNIGPGRSDVLLDSLFVAKKLLEDDVKKILVLGNGTSKFPKLLDYLSDGKREIYTTFDSRYHNNIDFSLSSEKRKFRNFFQVILSAEVFEHYRNPIKEFSFLKTILNNPGVIVGTTGAVEFREDERYLYLSKEPKSGHTSYYSKKSVSIIAESLGLIDYTDRASKIGHNRKKWRIALLNP